MAALASVLALCALAETAAAAQTHEYTLIAQYFQADPDKSGVAWVQGLNGSLPAPTLRVRRKDRLRLRLVNNLQTEEVVIHWHGFEMRQAQEYDGAMGITMCGVKPGREFLYDFVVDEAPGTYMYHEHAHLDHVAARGFMGGFIVDEEAGTPRLWQQYEPQNDVVLQFFEWWPKSQQTLELQKSAYMSLPNTQSPQGNGVGLLEFHNLLINGMGAYNIFGRYGNLPSGYVTTDSHVRDLYTIEPAEGETWRIRLANAGAMYAVRFRIDGHRLRVIQSDAADVEPYDCDAITMSSGERFDVLVTFDGTPGSYWMRVETLEGNGLHHGQMGVVRYRGTAADVVPDRGYRRRHNIFDEPQLVTLGCLDQAPISSTCRPLTDLRRHPSFADAHVGAAGDPVHTFEVGLRGFRGNMPAHFTRVVDGTNNYGENQFLGEYVQFHGPYVPYGYVNGTRAGEHPNTVTMRLRYGETVRVILQWQDRVAHPWHMHGHKFAVLGVFFNDYNKDCDIMYCRSENIDWLGRDGLPGDLLDPAVAPLKDTVHVPAGGWAVIQFKADNPGWWFFHCHMSIHVHDGMAAVIVEGDESDWPARLTDLSHYAAKGFPSCDQELAYIEKKGNGFSCSCWQDPEMKLDNKPLGTYKCSYHHLCAEPEYELGPDEEFQKGARNRASGRVWRLVMLLVEALVILLLFVCKRQIYRHHRYHARWVKELILKHPEILDLSRKRQTRRSSIGASTSGSESTSICVEDVDTDADHMKRYAGPPDVKTTPVRRTWRRSNSVVSATYDEDDVDFSALEELDELESQGLQMQWQAQVTNTTPVGPRKRLSNRISARRSTMTVVEPWADPCRRHLPPGSVLLLLGRPALTDPWLRFFSGRKQVGHIKVGGELQFGDEEPTLTPAELRLSRAYVPEIHSMRPTCMVIKYLEMQLCFAQAHDQTLDREKKLLHLSRFIKVFQLEDYLHCRLKDLSEEITRRVLIVQQLMVPRGVVVIKNPLADLEPPAAARMLKLFKTLARKSLVTIIFSSSYMSKVAGKSVDHILMQSSGQEAIFGSVKHMATILAEAGKGVPQGEDLYEFCSTLIQKGQLQGKLAKSLSAAASCCASEEGPPSHTQSLLISPLGSSQSAGPGQDPWVQAASTGSFMLGMATDLPPAPAPKPVASDEPTTSKASTAISFSSRASDQRGPTANTDSFVQVVPVPEKPAAASFRRPSQVVVAGRRMSQLSVQSARTHEQRDPRSRALPGSTADDAAPPKPIHDSFTQVAPNRSSNQSAPTVPSHARAIMRACSSEDVGSDADDEDENKSVCDVAMYERHESPRPSITSVTSALAATASGCLSNSATSMGQPIIERLKMPWKERRKIFTARRQVPFRTQLMLLLKDELHEQLKDYMTVYKFIETTAIGIVAGCVWFQKGSDDTQTALGETVGLFFFSTALWTVPPVFQALAATSTITERVRTEWVNGMYSLQAYVIAMGIASFLMTSVWVSFWQMIAYTMADLSESWTTMFCMHLVLSINTFTMRTIGLFLGVAVPKAALNVVIGNLFAQMCMLVNGFYTKLPGWLQWITVFSIPRYTFRALLKLEFSWDQSFITHPTRGSADLGFPTKYIPAEITGMFQNLHWRGLDIMQSHHASSPLAEMLIMTGLSVFFLCCFAMILRHRVMAG